MIESERQAVRAAIKLGSKVLSCGRFYESGPIVLHVEVPAEWRKLEAYRSAPWVSCVVPEEAESVTLKWAERNMK